jgi:hypothetical protein
MTCHETTQPTFSGAIGGEVIAQKTAKRKGEIIAVLKNIVSVLNSKLLDSENILVNPRDYIDNDPINGFEVIVPLDINEYEPPSKKRAASGSDISMMNLSAIEELRTMVIKLLSAKIYVKYHGFYTYKGKLCISIGV